MRLFALLFLPPVPVLACSCMAPSFDQMVQSPMLFTGEVIDGGIQSIREDPWHSSVTHVRFRVLERFRGVARGAERWI